MPWILISILILLILLFFLSVWMKKKNKRPIDYYNLFIIGIIWTAIGVPIKNYVLGGIGIAFLILGLVNKSKWKANRVRWDDLDENEKRMRIYLMIVLALLAIAGLVALLLTQKSLM